MPGSYGSPVAPILDTHTGAKPIFFNPPPHTPALATGRPGRHATGYDSFSTSKKRSRHDNSDSYFTTPFSTGSDLWDHSVGASIDRAGNAKSPPPLAYEKYHLAGGSETPQVLGNFQREADDYHNLGGQRRGYWDNTPAGGVMDGPSASNGMSQSTLRNLITMVGGVAGKLVQYCAVPFRGFHAGGGQGYDIQGGVSESNVWEKLSMNPELKAFPDASTLPGRFPEDNYGVLSIASVDETRPRTIKRQCTDDREWVMVQDSGDADSRASSPRLSERRLPALSTPLSPSQIPRPVSRAGSMAHGSSERPSRIPLSRRTSSARVSLVSNTGSPAFRKTASFASPRAREYNRQSYGSPVMFQVQQTSPLPAESQRLINKVKRDEMEEELRLRKMSAQTKLMLRQAREALGSKFEIEDFDNDMEDEGFSEAPYKRQGRGKWDAR
ncbi:uncharacterized protein BDZ99DRAFT_490577 [Mytilinidion resinicola]|uniref:Uncharacterized protein n=1 Tax=Mytilinidion resinicola TaxID=574789 RepID=A0A6A6YAL2_9PEZI|nr:uncharacterized protein BDZ99DRAFT_490577 [Mytilinidion resinicola]KAF2805543.1 hypothetical protein BDZ99DRAFT_490577 [Mytilinidion resinicola]